MGSTLQIVLSAVLVAIVLGVSYWGVNLFSQRRVKQDFKSPEDILAAVAVYMQYGRKRAAIALLEGGLDQYHDHPALKEKLEELTDGDA